MSRLTYIIISFLMLNFFAVYDYNTEIVQLVCRQNTLSYPNTIKVLQVIDVEEDVSVGFVGFELNIAQIPKSFLFTEDCNSQYQKNSRRFILFVADASPPLLL